MKKLLSLALAVLLIASVIVSVPITASAFNADNYKANITKISVGAPITGTDEKKYLPVTVYFTADEDLGDSHAVYFLEGYLKGMLANGDKFEGISGLGMTLMGPLKPDALEGMGSNAFSWQWSEGYGEGVLKYNIPLKEESDTQTIEHSSATGQDELNCVNVGDNVSFQIETVMNSSNIPSDMLPEGGSLFSDERTITIEDSSKYPKTFEFGNTCTITVHYVYAEGGQAAPDKVETCEIGFENYLINSPTIEGYTPDKSVVTGIPGGDKEETVTYTKNLPDLSKATVTGLSEDENKEYREDEAKSIGLEGLTENVDYTSSVKANDDNTKWIVTLEPVEDKAIGERVIELKKAKDTCTITVHYVYAEGGQAAPDKVEVCEIGFENYLINSPTIEGYTPDKNVVTGLPSGDKEETVTYTKNLPDLSKATVTGLSDKEDKEYKEDEAKSIGLEGLTKDVDYTSSVKADESGTKWIVTLEPVEGKAIGERVIELKKAKDTCTITVHYVYAEGGQAAPDKVEVCEIGFENYLINSPTIEGYTPDKNVVTGLPSGDKEETVTYTKNDITPAETVGSDEAPVITKAAYDPETKKLDVSFTTKDADSRYFEAYMLTDKKLDEGMGTFTVKGNVYDTLGIQSFNSDDASHVTVDKKTGKVTFSQELYFGKNDAPAIGETVYIAVQTEGKHAKDNWGEGSQLSELKKLVVGTPDAPEKKSIKDADVKVESGGTYTGKAKTPAVTVIYDGSKLKSGVDFTVTYSNNKNAGTAKAVVKGVGDYQDSVTVKFKIAKAGNKVKVTGKAVSVKAKTLKTKKASFKVAVITNAQGKVKITLTANKLKGKLSINNDGKITIKKGKYAKETYKVKISVTAAGNTNYTSKTITKTIKIKIK